jgi:hypothetical protein
VPKISLKDWTSAYQWVKKRNGVAVQEKSAFTRYYVSRSDFVKLTDKKIKIVEMLSWNTFDYYQKQDFFIWTVSIPADTH